MAYRVHWKRQGVYTEWLGRATSGEVIRFQDEIQSDARFDSIRYSIHDYTNCDQIIFDSQDMDEVAAMDFAASLTNQHIVVAIIAVRPEFVEMMKAYLRLGISPYPVKQFTDFASALKWLDGYGIRISSAEFEEKTARSASD